MKLEFITPKEAVKYFDENATPSQKIVIHAILRELQKAEAKHPKWPSKNVTHAAAIVSEESGELIKAAIQYDHEGGQYDEIINEAVQTGAMCVRLLNNLNDYKEK